MRSSRGITLIVLIVVVIVILILSGVTISLILGNNGVLTMASTSIISNTKSKAKEDVSIAWAGLNSQYFKEHSQNSSITKEEYFTKEKLQNFLFDTGIVNNLILSNDLYIISYTEKEQLQQYTFRIDDNGNIEFLENGTVYEVDAIPENYYGKTVNYISNNGISDWKIFYSDENNIFLISSNYVTADKIITESNIGLIKDEDSSTYPYNIWWNSAPISAHTMISKKSWNNWNTSWSSNNNGKCVSILLNSDNWLNFKDDNFADYAIGAPTIEMFVDSINKKYPNENRIVTVSNSNGFGIYSPEADTNNQFNEDEGLGYIIDLSDCFDEEFPEQNGIGHKSYNDTLYFPFKTENYNCLGYWLASTSAFDEGNIMFVEYDGILQGVGYSNNICGIRPIVCLKSSVNLIEGTDGYDFNLK